MSGPAEAVQSWSSNNIGSCVEGGNSLGGGGGSGGSGGMLPGEILKFSFSKCTFGAFKARINKKVNRNLR